MPGSSTRRFPVTGAQFGTMQVVRQREDGSERWLELLVSQGLTPQDRAVWEHVALQAPSSCALALRSGQRAIIADFETWPEIAGTDDLEAFRRAGICAAQTTPLRSRDGTLLGMISTHWSKPHQPCERDLRMLDILARQAADLLYRTIAEEALRDREKELRGTVASLREMQELQNVVSGELDHRVKNLFAMVTAITSHTLRESSDQLRVQTLQQRLRALSSAHDILLQSKGPEVVKPEGTGFGSRLISAGLVGSGGVVAAYNSTGLVCEFSAPVSQLQGPE